MSSSAHPVAFHFCVGVEAAGGIIFREGCEPTQTIKRELEPFPACITIQVQSIFTLKSVISDLLMMQSNIFANGVSNYPF